MGSITSSSLENFNYPIIISETNGKIVYKNSLAKNTVRVPLVGASIVPHLFEDVRHKFSEANSDAITLYSEFPCFLEIISDLKVFRLFADIVNYEGRRAIAFFFSHLFTNELAEALFPNEVSEINRLFSGERLVRLGSALDDIGIRTSFSEKQRAARHLSQIFCKLAAHIVESTSFGCDYLVYTLDRTIDILDYACRQVFSRVGLDFVFSRNAELTAIHLIDFKAFAPIAATLLTFAAELTLSETVGVRLEAEDEVIKMSMSFTAAKPQLLPYNRKRLEEHPSAQILSSSAKKLFSLLPLRSLDIVFFDRACREHNYSFNFIQNDETKNTLELSAPILLSRAVRSQDHISFSKVINLIDSFAELYSQELNEIKELRG